MLRLFISDKICVTACQSPVRGNEDSRSGLHKVDTDVSNNYLTVGMLLSEALRRIVPIDLSVRSTAIILRNKARLEYLHVLN